MERGTPCAILRRLEHLAKKPGLVFLKRAPDVQTHGVFTCDSANKEERRNLTDQRQAGRLWRRDYHAADFEIVGRIAQPTGSVVV